MLLTALDTRHYSIEEWLALEEETGLKYEYHDGELFSVEATSGGTYAHALLWGNSIRAAGRALDRQRSPCLVLTSDIRLKIPRHKKYVYPDAAITCEDPLHDDIVKTAISNPVVVIEVLSPSTAAYDLGPKFGYYRRMKSLRDYVLIHQDQYLVEVRSRESHLSLWNFAEYETVAQSVRLPSLRLEVPMDELYRGLRLSAKPIDELLLPIEDL